MFEKFTVIPSIDLKGGQVVRLLHGDMNRATVYGGDPGGVARRFEQAGAELIHIVDLDGAIAGTPRNLDAVARIRAAGQCAIDVSGGLRTIEAVRAMFAGGADRVSIGSAALLDPALGAAAPVPSFPDRVFGSLDIRDGRLAVKGWVETSQLTLVEAADRFRAAGVAAAIVTDIGRDGAQVGVDAGADVRNRRNGSYSGDSLGRRCDSRRHSGTASAIRCQRGGRRYRSCTLRRKLHAPRSVDRSQIIAMRNGRKCCSTSLYSH